MNKNDLSNEIDTILEDSYEKIKNKCGTVGWLGWNAVLLFNFDKWTTWQFWAYFIVGGFLGATTGIVAYPFIKHLIVRKRVFGSSDFAIKVPAYAIWILQFIFAFILGRYVFMLL